MDLATYARESARNRQAYKRLQEQVRREYAGQYVALANGKLIGAAPTFAAARALVEQLNDRPEYFLIFPAHVDPDFNLVYDLAGSV